jgi:hypothetical protein
MYWIKMRVNLERDEAIVLMAKELHRNEFTIIGMCYAFWSFADAQTKDGLLKHPFRWIDDNIVNCPGFCVAMQRVGWLSITEEYVDILKWDRHNGKSAKKRCDSYARKDRHKAKKQWEKEEQDFPEVDTGKEDTW